MRGKLNILVVVFCLSTLAFAVAGCSTPAGRSAGEWVDDGTIKTKVKARLAKDSILHVFAIGVNVFHGEVTLTGAVNIPEQRDLAEQIALETRGVTKVNNLLKLK
ncbi:MAG: BON domain-containing protein [Thermodesulfobacteriota bacterium]